MAIGSISGLTQSKRLVGIGLVALAAIIVLDVLFTSFRSVGVGRVGIVTQFGNVVAEDQSGLHIIAPWPIQSMSVMNIQTQKEQEQEEAATKDLQEATTTVALNYHIDPLQVMNLFRRVGVNYEQTIILPALQETLKSVTANYNATDLVDQRPQVVGDISRQITTLVKPWGIFVDNVSIVNFSFSSLYSQAIESRAAAAANVQTQQYNLQAAQLQAQAQETQKSSLSSQYLELQAINKWDGKMPNYLGTGGVFNIPLQNSGQ